MPALCNGGDITQDTSSGGCRSIACAGPDSTLQVLACDKPGSYQPSYFEMYRQGGTGNGVEICLGVTCIRDNGFAKSNNYPLCSAPTSPPVIPLNGTLQLTSTPYANITLGGQLIGTSPMNWSLAPGAYSLVAATPGHVQKTVLFTISANASTAVDFTLDPQGASVCFSALQEMPASCEGGTITNTDLGGCRSIVCTSGDDSLSVLACEKSGFFEMYKQGQQGSAVTKVCLGTTCITDNGYAKSGMYPLCS
jgi:hypothetical protein